MIMNKVFFSVIVPVYNVELYLSDCLESILAQTYSNYEVICVEDCSEDDSLKILQKYKKIDNRIRILQNKENRGLSFSRNQGIINATGDYVVFVDSDDMLKQNTLQTLYNTIISDKVDIVYFDMESRKEGEWAKERIANNNLENEIRYDGIYNGQDFFVETFNNNDVKIQAWRQAFSLDFLRKNNLLFYEGIYHEDNLFSVLCAIKAQRVKYICQELYIYRRRDNSIMSTMSEQRMKSLFVVFIELWNYWKEHELTEKMSIALRKYLLETLCRMKSMQAYYPNTRELGIGGAAEQLMFELLCTQEKELYRFVDFSKEQLNMIKKAKTVIIYGAGEAAIETVRFLKRRDIEVKHIIVSNKKNNAQAIFNIPVVQYDEIAIVQEALIIIAISIENKNAIENVKRKLLQLGYSNFMLLKE